MLLALVLLMGFVSVNPAPAMATGSGPIPLGDATSFAVLGASTVTDTNSSTIDGSVGVSPGTAVVESAPPMVVTNGSIHRADSVAAAAKVSAQEAYTAAGSRTSTQVVAADLSIAGLGGGNTLAPGVYTSASSLGLTGTLILDGQMDPNAVFIFRAGSTLTTAAASVIELRNGAQAANVFWQIGSSATLGTHSTFIGTIVAQASVTSTTAVAVNGRLLALTGAVTMDGGTVTVPTVVTAATVPGAPTGVRATAGTAAATVAWATSDGGGGASATTRYTVVSSGGQSVVVTGASATSATVTGLTNGTAYTFTVTATNWAGDSLASAASTAVTPALATGPAVVDPKSAATFSAVALTYVTLATTSTVSGDVAAGGAITKGNPSAVGGHTHELNNEAAQQARIDVGTAYDDALARPASPISGVLDGQTLTAGVYHSAAAFSLAAGGKLTLDGEGNSNAVFILKTNGAIVTGASSRIDLVNGARASNVFWQTPSHIVFGASSRFSGTLLAQSYISFGASAQLAGRALSGSYVSMDAASINTPTPTIVPGAPQNTSATSGNGHARVWWDAPASIGSSAITGYTVTSSPAGFAAFVDGQARSATVSGLTNGTAYTFTVVASNDAGDSIASTASTAITARSVPLPPSNASASSGNAEVTLTWVAPTNTGGSPIVDYTVTSSGGQTVTVTGTTATVTGLSNGTSYTFTVTATNAAGTSLASAASLVVTPMTVPGVPVGVVATAGNALATVSWAAPTITGGSPIVDYTVKSSGGETVTVSGTSATVMGLSNGTSYTFIVVARNGAGNSLASIVSNVVTARSVPLSPTGVSAAPGNAEATVSWTLPVSNGGSVITGFTVTSSPGGFAAFAGGTSTSATVTGLANGTAYTFMVTATNAAGTSAPSIASDAITPATVPGVPGGVSATAGNAQAMVSWDAPTVTGGLPITEYTVRSFPVGFTATTTGATSVAVTGLTNGTPYTFTVTATNASGTSLVSVWSTTVTPATTPSLPTEVVATAGDAHAVVSWTAPASPGGSIIMRKTVISSPGGHTATTTGNATSATVWGLTNDIEYTFTVFATNRVGHSLVSSASTPVTPAAAPRATVGVPPSIAVSSPPNGSVGTQYSSFTVPTTGFPAPVFAVTAGALPAGLVLRSSTGRITGTPTTAGSSTFTITARNGVGTPATAIYTIVVRAPRVSLVLNFLPGSNVRDATATATASGFEVGSEYRIVMRSTPVLVHSGTVGSTGTVNWRGSLPTGIPAGAHSLTLHGVAADGAALSAVVWFSFNASGEIVATSQIGPVPDPALGSVPDPVMADVPILQDPIRAGLFSPITPAASSTGRTSPTHSFIGWTDAGVTRDSGAVEFWMYPGLLTLLFTSTLLGAGWCWLIAARRRRRSEEEPEDLPAGALA